ncbi:hypothetical protein [Sphingomonas sp. GM_Shp_2]|uniref:hypothetical protein n=1 Tax=Sphingomonas sp. GM_Shp_2 TaxID=2937380 RepID=UPI0022699434
MIQLSPIIERIRALLQEDSEASITYAALEARLALEKVCYDRLRQRHAYISHDQLGRWQPGAIINTLMADVDEHVGQTLTISIAKNPVEAGVDPQDEEYVPLGTQVGFDTKRIVKMWNALAKLALHVRLPEHKDDHIADYGDKAQVRAKVEEVVAELERLATGTMAFSGLGNEVSFVCSCGEKNKRRAGLLRDGQQFSCINPQCKILWKATKEGDEFSFESVTVSIFCEQCKADNLLPWRLVREMKRDEVGSFHCHTCRHMNYIQWRLSQVRPAHESERVEGVG